MEPNSQLEGIYVEDFPLENVSKHWQPVGPAADETSLNKLMVYHTGDMIVVQTFRASSRTVTASSQLRYGIG
jgi:hypothetical protein